MFGRQQGRGQAGLAGLGALLFLALPAESQDATAAADATVSAVFHCPADECHVAPVTDRTGFVGGVANAGSTVSYAVTCNGHLIAREAEQDSRGGVAVLLTEENGFACPEGGQLEVHGLDDGGWYWIVFQDRAVAAPLIAKDTIDVGDIEPWDPDTLDIDLIPLKHGHATLVRDDLSGSLGLLPHILPQPGTPRTPRCGPVREGEDWKQLSTGCSLGEGRTAIAARYAGTFVRPAATSVTLFRPGFQSLEVQLSLWGDGQGHISTANPVVPRHGHYVPGATPFAASSWSVRLNGASPGATGSLTLSGRILTIDSDEEYCNPRGNPPVDIPITVTVTAVVDDPGAVAVAPPIKVDDDNVAATRDFVIRCPAAVANRGRDLVFDPPTGRGDAR